MRKYDSSRNIWYSRFDGNNDKMSHMQWALDGQRMVPRGEHDKAVVFLMQVVKFPQWISY